MRKTALIWILIAAALISAGLVTFFIFGKGTPIGTQVTGSKQSTPGDRDGDGVSDYQDYFPDDPDK